jgi:hypothetical protein
MTNDNHRQSSIKLNIKKNYKFVLETNEYGCLVLCGIYRVLVKFQMNIKISFMNLNQELNVLNLSRFLSFFFHFVRTGGFGLVETLFL